jgi:hypothetical protein
MQVTCSSETLVNFHWTTQWHIPQNRTLHNHCCENLNPLQYGLKQENNSQWSMDNFMPTSGYIQLMIYFISLILCSIDTEVSFSFNYTKLISELCHAMTGHQFISTSYNESSSFSVIHGPWTVLLQIISVRQTFYIIFNYVPLTFWHLPIL